MTIQLQVGKKYITRNGSVYGPLFYDDVHGVFTISPEEPYAYWIKSGKYRYHDTYDFVSEYVDKSKFLVAGKKYRLSGGVSGGARDAVCLTTTEEQAVMLVYRAGYRYIENFFVYPIPISNEDERFTPVESFDEGTIKQEEDF